MTLYEHYQIEREEGREEGRITGLAEGLETGRAEGLVQAVDALKNNMQLPLEDACRALNITVEEYKKTKATMD